MLHALLYSANSVVSVGVSIQNSEEREFWEPQKQQKKSP